jgi:hypothetical protein
LRGSGTFRGTGFPDELGCAITIWSSSFPSATVVTPGQLGDRCASKARGWHQEDACCPGNRGRHRERPAPPAAPNRSTGGLGAARPARSSSRPSGADATDRRRSAAAHSSAGGPCTTGAAASGCRWCCNGRLFVQQQPGAGLSLQTELLAMEWNCIRSESQCCSRPHSTGPPQRTQSWRSSSDFARKSPGRATSAQLSMAAFCGQVKRLLPVALDRISGATSRAPIPAIPPLP